MAGDPSEEERTRQLVLVKMGWLLLGLFEKDEYFVGDLIFASDLLTGDRYSETCLRENAEAMLEQCWER